MHNFEKKYHPEILRKVVVFMTNNNSPDGSIPGRSRMKITTKGELLWMRSWN